MPASHRLYIDSTKIYPDHSISGVPHAGFEESLTAWMQEGRVLV